MVFEAEVESPGSSRIVLRDLAALPRPDLLRRSGATGRDRDGVDRPTVAGLLAFGRDPTDFLRSAFIGAARYGGTEASATELVREARLDGRMDARIAAAVAFVAAAGTAGGHSGAAVFAPYDPEVVAEGIVNAVAAGTTRSTVPRADCSGTPTAWKSAVPAGRRTA